MQANIFFIACGGVGCGEKYTFATLGLIEVLTTEYKVKLQNQLESY